MAKLSPPITLKALKDLKAAGKTAEVADGACPGLRIRVGTAGAMTWSLLARDSDGVRRRIECGSWPEIGIPQAREIANQFKAAIKRETRPAGRLTLGGVIVLYGQEKGAERSSWTEAERCTRKVFGSLLERPAGDLQRAEVQRIADAYPARHAASAAVRYLRPILNWAELRRYVPEANWAKLQQPASTRKRDRVLTPDELKRVLGALGRHGHDGAARFMLLTALRREEVCALRFEDIVEDVACVKLKGGREAFIPLSVDAQTLIGAQGRTSGLVFVGDRGKRLQNWDRWQESIYTRTGTEGWHRHDLRRTAATLLGKEGVAPHVVEMVLCHKHAHSDLASIYNQSRYEKEHLEALELLSGILMRIAL